jgi:RES domain-containing protein
VPLSVAPVAVRGEWVRHAPHRAALLGRKERLTAGRWQRADLVHGLYLADCAETAIAEWYRWLAEHGLRPGSRVPHDHHHWEVSLDVADLSTPERLAAVGLDPPRPSRRTWAPFQAVGDALWEDGWRGILAPSAARPGSQVLCVFAEEWPPDGCFPVSIETIGEVPPPPVGMTT